MATPDSAHDDTRWRRLLVVGTSGSGKTWLARELSGMLDIPHVELDALHFGPDWSERPDAELRRLVSQATSGERWVVDGNYSVVRDLLWPRATHLLWLDYPFALVFGRTLRRTLRRALTRERLWAGNRETLRKAFLSRESILLWVIKTHRRRRLQYAALTGSPEHARLRVLRLRRPAETEQLLGRLRRSARDGADPPLSTR